MSESNFMSLIPIYVDVCILVLLLYSAQKQVYGPLKKLQFPYISSSAGLTSRCTVSMN